MKPFERSTHSGRLARYLGEAKTEELSNSFHDWYGPPVVLAIPGGSFVRVGPGGDFRGRLLMGAEATALCIARSLWQGYKRAAKTMGGRLNALTSWDGVLSAAAAGNARHFDFAKVGTTGVVGGTNSLWHVGTQPVTAAAGTAAPGGLAPTDATTGAVAFTNPSAGTLHLTGATVQANISSQSILVYDRIFEVAKTMNSTANEAVTGVPTRYQSTTGGAADSAEGNFLMIEVGTTALAATAHNWDTCLYTDQAGNGSAALPTVTGNSGAIARRLDHPLNRWFCPLASDDTGIQQLDQMHCSAAVATGLIDFVIGHPLAIIPVPVLNLVSPWNGMTGGGQRPLVRIFDDACIAFLEMNKPATSATTYSITLDAVFG